MQSHEYIKLIHIAKSITNNYAYIDIDLMVELTFTLIKKIHKMHVGRLL